MRKNILIFILVLIGLPLWAQQDSLRTLFPKTKSLGGYGAAMYRYGTIADRHTFINGGRGGVIVNKSFGIGVAGCGFHTEYKNDRVIDTDYQLNGGYGGLLFEPIFFHDKAIHFTVPIVIGGGGVSYSPKHQDDNKKTIDAKPFFVLEPGVEIEINLLKWLRFNAGAYYRVASETKLTYSDDAPIAGIDKDVMNNLSFGVSLKFEKF